MASASGMLASVMARAAAVSKMFSVHGHHRKAPKPSVRLGAQRCTDLVLAVVQMAPDACPAPRVVSQAVKVSKPIKVYNAKDPGRVYSVRELTCMNKGQLEDVLLLCQLRILKKQPCRIHVMGAVVEALSEIGKLSVP